MQAAGNPINVANALASRSLQSAKQLRIYLTPSQAIKHFSFIHGRCRAATHAIPARHPRERDTRQPDTDTFSPIDAAAAVAVALLLLLLASCSARQRQNNSHIWHATCLCFWPWVIDDHANDQQQAGGESRRSRKPATCMRCSCCCHI